MPRLSRFYGPHPWLVMPLPVLNAYIVREPQLRARERLERIEDMALGSGLIERDDRTRRVREIEGAASPVTERRPRLTREQAAVMLAAMGVGVRVVPREAVAQGADEGSVSNGQ